MRLERMGENTMKHRWIVVAAVAAAFTHSAAAAGPIDDMFDRVAGTMNVYTQPYLRNGQLSGCQLVYSAIQRDWVYRKGQFLKLEGSVGLMEANGGLGTFVKIVVMEIEVSNQGKLSFNPSPPDRAYIVASNFDTNLSGFAANVPSDTPGGVFSAYHLNPTADMLIDAMKEKVLTVSFNMPGGETDIQVAIDLTVEDTNERGERKRSDKAIGTFSNCIVALSDQMDAASKKGSRVVQ